MEITQEVQKADCKMSSKTEPQLISEVPERQELRDVFCFETDHMALKGNPDYQNLLKTICILQAQRIQAVADIDTLHKQQQDALSDPIGFVDKLQKGESLNFPKTLQIPTLPSINWEKYTNSMDFSAFGNHRHMTRIKRQLVEGNTEDEGPIKPKPQILSGEQTELVRGRLKDPNKPATFNVLWTAEEQKRLEDCLVQFPPEEVEARRWQKIANALGNRTMQQVASRVQKYFIKLAKAGLPVPGRAPTTGTHRKTGHRHHRYNATMPGSTFLQSHEPPVYMSDDDDSISYAESNETDFVQYKAPDDAVDSDDEQIPVDLRNTPEYQEMVRLKRLRKVKVQSENKNVLHKGYKCDKCNCDPIIGTRWHCTDCPQESAVDFCDDCVDSFFETADHNSSHRLKPLQKAINEPSLDQDYMRFMSGDYNYLDPNYMPAS